MNFLSTKPLFHLITISIFFIINSSSFATTPETDQSTSIQKKFAELEASSKGRIGIYAINTANHTHLDYRANERFPTGCTSKVIGVATILSQSMNDPTLLSQRISYSKNDLTHWSPITKKYLSSGMTVEQLCAASISYSDNTAMNLLVKKMGGLEQMTLYARSLGNNSFRQDNGWPEEAYSGGKGNLKDSSTPEDMAKSLQKLVFTDVLAKPQRKMLMAWLNANTTGDFRIKAGLPKGWRVADKTGTGGAYGTTNDLGVIWPPGCDPIIMAIYYTSDDKLAEKRDDVIASSTRLLINQLAQSDQCIRQNIDEG
ncbi:class A beta-lactamase [Legionella yabuuchiae]|uniref:class A beta-lactamase n=1 Tax=Legionella yabuuchiae TaxID=376727 RepID=UPI0010556AAB|nr:class A beta-lactamase [Legionella yabuuchiae]